MIIKIYPLSIQYEHFLVSMHDPMVFCTQKRLLHGHEKWIYVLKYIGQMEGHTNIQREDVIPQHCSVAGYGNRISLFALER